MHHKQELKDTHNLSAIRG